MRLKDILMHLLKPRNLKNAFIPAASLIITAGRYGGFFVPLPNSILSSARTVRLSGTGIPGKMTILLFIVFIGLEFSARCLAKNNSFRFENTTLSKALTTISEQM